MHPAEIEACLDSMSILIDRREQPTDRAKRRYDTFCVPYSHATLDYGDYTYNFKLPSGKSLYGADTLEKRVCPPVSVERKMNLDELAQCFTRGRKRFVAEFERAKAHNARIYLLVENANFENLINGKYKSKFQAKAYLASVTAFMARYDMKIIMCKAETSGRLIKEILYRELKERLINGEYDQSGMG